MNYVMPLADKCYFCGSLEIVRAKRKIANGTFQILDWCQECGRNARKTHLIAHHQAGNIDALPQLSDATTEVPPCARCGSTDGVEEHHFGVKHIFGNQDADTWPRAFLCRKCHQQWHEVVAQHYQECGLCRNLYGGSPF